MVLDSGRTVIVRASASAGRTRPSVWNFRWNSRRIFSGYTHASIRPDSSPSNPARIPVTGRNPPGRPARESSSNCGGSGAGAVGRWEFLPVTGMRAGLLGDESGRMEAWVNPLKILREFHLKFHTE